MLHTWLLIAGISLGNNLDNVGLGIAYGASRIRVSTLVGLWIALITFFITGASAALGDRMGTYLPEQSAKLLSAILLFVVGIYILRPVMAKRGSAGCSASNSLVDILDDPLTADRVASQYIDLREGTLLGVAMSINNVGGGVSAGLLHLPAVAIAMLSAVMSFVAIRAGGSLGTRLSCETGQSAPLWAGGLLIAIAIFEFR